MLPFPIFLFLLISATLLAPPPPVLLGSLKLRVPTLRSFEWSSLLTFIPDPDTQSSPEDVVLFPLGMPSVTPNPLPTKCCPNSTLVANNTVPHSFVRATDERSSSTAVLLVISLAILNYFVYRLLVHIDEPDESHDAERKSGQFTAPLSGPAAPPQESIYHHCTLTVEETPHPFLSVDTANPVSESLEHGSLPYSTKSPSTPSSATTILLQSPAPLGQSLLFPVISHGFSLDSSEKATSSPSTFPTSGCTLIDSPSVSATQTAAFGASNALSVEPAVWIDDSEAGLLECTPLDTEAAKVAISPFLELSNIRHPRNPEPSGELQDDSVSSPAIEDARDLDADEDDVFCYQPSNSEGDDDKMLDYKEVDSTPEAPKTPPAPATEDRALPSPRFRLRSRGHSLDYASSFSAKKTALEEVVNTHLASPRFPFLHGRTSEGQNEGEITSITRRASVDDLVSTFGASNAAHASIITDCPSPTSRCDIFDDAAYHQVTTLSSLRADAPIFKPRSSVMNEVVALKSVSLGLEASIHAPRDEEILQTQGRVEVLDATTNTPECLIESGGFQTYTDVVEELELSGDARPTKSASLRVADGLRVSIHAPPDPSTRTLRALGDDMENLEKEPTHSMTRPNSTRSGLYASIHAPAAGQSGQSAQRSSKHHTDVPNWAAICRAEKSSTEGSPPAECGGNSPGSATTALDEGASELSPTTTRCAASDQERSFVDDSDGSSLVHADDREDTTIGSGEADSTLDEGDAPDDQGSTGTKPLRKSRRRGGRRRTRHRIPYVSPPRMQNPPVTDRPFVDVRAQGPAGQMAPPSLGRHHYYAHAPPAPPHHPTSAPGLMIPPNGIIYDQFGQYPHYYPSSPHMMAPTPGFQPPAPHHPMFYPVGPHPHVSPHAPSTLLYGR